jgi:DNA processing protein
LGDGADKLPMIRLALVPGVGPRTRKSLLDRFGSAEAALTAAPSDLRSVAGVGTKLCRAILDAPNAEDVESELRRCREHAIEVVTESDDGYPPNLRHICDPPGVLFRDGTWLEQDTLAIALVGTRHATHYGRRQAERLAAGLSHAGLTIISGLARGIDAAAHRGALAASGRTVAVLASGLLCVYPPEHAGLAAEIAGSGAVLSEVPITCPPLQGAFPQRNRIISGLSLGVIVVEAPERSGALITAEQAMEQGREVFAVPGPIDSRASRGCHRLLREGAKLVESVDDVLEELGPLFESAIGKDGSETRHPAELQLNEQELAVLHAIDLRPTSIDDVVRNSQIPVQRVLATVSVLEMRHLVRRITGNTLVRV